MFTVGVVLIVAFIVVIYWISDAIGRPTAPASERWEFSRGKKRFAPAFHRNIFEMNFIAFKSPFLSLCMGVCVCVYSLIFLLFVVVQYDYNLYDFYLHSHTSFMYVCTHS